MKLDIPYLADEIAQPRPDMNIKVAAFTVSEKSSKFLIPYTMATIVYYTPFLL